MKTDTEPMRMLEDETREARERFEINATTRPEIWAACERWQRDANDERMWSRLGSDPALRQLWSAYVRLEVRLHTAASLPNWPFSIGAGDPMPPGGKRIR